MKFFGFIVLLASLLASQAEIPEMESVEIKVTQSFDFSVTGEAEAPVGGSLTFLRSVKVSAEEGSPRSYLISGLLVDGNVGAPVVNYPLSISDKETQTPPVFAGMTNALGEFVIRVRTGDRRDVFPRAPFVKEDFEGYLYIGQFASKWEPQNFPIFGLERGVIRYDLSTLWESYGVKTKAVEDGDKPSAAPEIKPEMKK